MASNIKTGKDTYLSVGPPIHPAFVPAALVNGFEGTVPYATWYKPTKEELFLRDQCICNLDQWTRQCKTTASITQGTETTDVSDDCQPDAQIITKNTRSLSFTSNDYKGVIDADGDSIPIPPDTVRWLEMAYKSEGCLLVPILWTDCPKDDDGARGILFIGTVSQFDFPGGGINDPNTLSVTIVPGSTPLRQADQQAMFNVICVTCFSNTTVDQLPDDFYLGEQLIHGSSLLGDADNPIEPCPWTKNGGEVVETPDVVIDGQTAGFKSAFAVPTTSSRQGQSQKEVDEGGLLNEEGGGVAVLDPPTDEEQAEGEQSAPEEQAKGEQSAPDAGPDAGPNNADPDTGE